MRRGRKEASPQQEREIVDLYVWGMQLAAIAWFYDCDVRTVKRYARRAGVTPRLSGRPVGSRSNQRKTLSGEELHSIGDLSVDQLIRSYARELRDKRIAEHQAGANTCSCPEALFSSRYGFLRSGSRQTDPE